MLSIIVEGPDRAGKTTLVNKLAEILGKDGGSQHYVGKPYVGYRCVGIFHNGVHEEPFSAYLDQLVTAIKNPGSHFIWDRFWPSNLVYGPIAGGKMLTAEQTSLIRNMSLYINCFVVLCLPPWSEVKERWEANLKNELIKDEHKMYEIYQFYSSGTFSIGQTIVNPFNTSAEEILNRIVRHVKWTE